MAPVARAEAPQRRLPAAACRINSDFVRMMEQKGRFESFPGFPGDLPRLPTGTRLGCCSVLWRAQHLDKWAANLHWGAEKEGRLDHPALMPVGLGSSPPVLKPAEEPIGPHGRELGGGARCTAFTRAWSLTATPRVMTALLTCPDSDRPGLLEP